MPLLGNQNYSPPYESELEELFASNLDKYLADGVKITKQVEVQTFCGVRRLDFVASNAGQRSVAFECDGTEFHDESRDEWRDAIILDATGYEAIYRFPGPLLYHHMEDCLYLLAKWESHLFSDRGLKNLELLASPEAKARRVSFSGALLIYASESGLFCRRIGRNVLQAPTGCISHLKTILNYAKRSGLNNLDTIIEKYRQGIGLDEVRAEYFQDSKV